MKTLPIAWPLRAGGLALLLTVALAAHALDRGTFLERHAFVVGGVGQDEVAQLEQERGNYTLKLVTADRATTAYLADVRVLIRDAGQKVVFDRVLSGPWLLIDLPPGRYDIDASFQGQAQRSSATITGRQRQDINLMFNARG